MDEGEILNYFIYSITKIRKDTGNDFLHTYKYTNTVEHFSFIPSASKQKIKTEVVPLQSKAEPNRDPGPKQVKKGSVWERSWALGSVWTAGTVREEIWDLGGASWF